MKVPHFERILKPLNLKHKNDSTLLKSRSGSVTTVPHVVIPDGEGTTKYLATTRSKDLLVDPKMCSDDGSAV